MALELKKAQRSRAYLRLGMSAPSGGGKTLGSLLIAYGLLKQKYPKLSSEELWEKVAIIDTENGSGELYVNKVVDDLRIGEYNVVTLTQPFTAEKYVSAIELCQENFIEVCIIDSTTHLWAGQGGLLEQQGTATKKSGNSYTAWREVTPMHNRFVDVMLQSKMHIIATMRSKTEYVQEKNDQGKTIVKKLGMNPVQRDGMEFEFTTFLDIDSEHTAFGSKDRTSIFDQKYVKITPQVGKDLMKWLDEAVDTEKQVVATKKSDEERREEEEKSLKDLQEKAISLIKELGGSKNDELMKTVKSHVGESGNPNKIKSVETLNNLIVALEVLVSNKVSNKKEKE